MITVLAARVVVIRIPFMLIGGGEMVSGGARVRVRESCMFIGIREVLIRFPGVAVRSRRMIFARGLVCARRSKVHLAAVIVIRGVAIMHLRLTVMRCAG